MLTRRPNERLPVGWRSALDWLNQEPWFLEFGADTRGALTPPVDVRETDDALIVEMAMPGITPEEIEVTLDGRTLAIRARTEKDAERQGDEGRYLVREREVASYARVIMLPTEVDADKVMSSFENGELRLTLPKAVDRRSRRIPIAAAEKPAQAVVPGAKGPATDTAPTAPPALPGEPVTADPSRMGQPTHA
jgi:HSP20 family protein